MDIRIQSAPSLNLGVVVTRLITCITAAGTVGADLVKTCSFTACRCYCVSHSGPSFPDM
jgi:hypothetical protein